MKVPFSVDLRDKTAVVTGGGGVLCGGMAEVLAASGARVAVLDLNRQAADGVAERIRSAGGQAVGVPCNVLEKENIVAAKEEVEKAFGPADILINGAGGNHPRGTTSKEFLLPEDLRETVGEATRFFDLDPEGIRFVFNLNFLGTLLPTQVFAHAMAKKEKGTVVNISSMNAFTPLTKIPAYSAAKAAVSNFTQWLAVHLSKVNIRVNAIAPGFFLTDQNRSLLMDGEGQPTARARTILEHTPMGRFGAAEDLAGTLLWLVSDQGAGFVTGTVVAVDGGFSAFSGV